MSLHPGEVTLREYALGWLDADAAGAVRAHLASCETCRVGVVGVWPDNLLDRTRDAQAHDPTMGACIPPELLTLTQYEVRRVLGGGGMGVVYLAYNHSMGRLEALKVLNKELERHSVIERFLREIRSAGQLDHPNVVTAYAFYTAGHLLVFAMQYVEGEDLASLVGAQGPLPVEPACHYVYQAALGLQHSHEKGLVHRDIKPKNLILMRVEQETGVRLVVKILDFGLAKAASESPVEGALTGSQSMLGTPHYIAPEQALDAHKADIRADIYSLGCTLYFLLTGQPPYVGSSMTAILLAHQTTMARPAFRS